MRALVHLSAPELRPVGIWWVDEEGVLKSRYLPDTEYLELTANDQMAEKLEETSWEDYWTNQLVHQHPYTDTYELVDVTNPLRFLEYISP